MADRKKVSSDSRGTSIPTRRYRYVDLLSCSIIVLLFDAGAASLSRLLFISYANFILPEAVIYFVIGYVFRRRGVSLTHITVVLLAVSAVEATVGAQIAAWIGPGRTPPTASIVVLAAFVVTVLGATLVGIIGALFGTPRLKRQS